MSSILSRRYPMSKENFIAWDSRLKENWVARNYPTVKWVLFVNGCVRLVHHLEREIETTARFEYNKYDCGVMLISPDGKLLDYIDKLPD